MRESIMPETSSILQGTGEIIDTLFNLKENGKKSLLYKNKKSSDRLNQKPVDNAVLNDLVRKVFKKIESNLTPTSRFFEKGPSKENWRFETQGYIRQENKSIEKKVEKNIANLMGDDWVNQVPVASGLINGSADKKRAIDLVCRRSPGAFEFIELKIIRKNNTFDSPLWAAMELMEYGLLYLHAQNNYPKELIEKHEILQAHQINLVVLAPFAFYTGYQFKWLEDGLTLAFRNLILSESFSNVDVKFRFYDWPKSIDIGTGDDIADTIKAINNRKPVQWETVR